VGWETGPLLFSNGQGEYIMADKVKQEIEKLYPSLFETWLLNIVEWVKPFDNAGLNLLVMGDIKLSDVVIDDFGNTARSDGLNDSKIRGHQRNINNGKYQPKHHPPILVEPIFVNGELKFKLINGHHRYQAHLGLDKEFIYVAIGTFNDTDGESAEYWREDYQINSNNDEDYIITLTTDEDIIGSCEITLKREFGELPDSKHEQKIKDRIDILLKRRAPKKQNKDKFKKAILEKLGVSFEVIKDWQKNNAEAFCSKISEGKEFVLQRFTNVSYDKRNTTLFTQYEWSLYKHIEEYRKNNNGQVPDVYAYFGNTSKENLDKYRKHFQKRLKQQDAFSYRLGFCKTPIIKFLPQKESEGNNIVEVSK